MGRKRGKKSGVKPRANADKVAAALEALPKKDKGRLLGYVRDHVGEIRRAMDKGYTYKEIVVILAEADHDMKISEGTLRVYMAQLSKTENEGKPQKQRRSKPKSRGQPESDSTSNEPPAAPVPEDTPPSDHAGIRRRNARA
jgi:hypothetical protein